MKAMVITRTVSLEEDDSPLEAVELPVPHDAAGDERDEVLVLRDVELDRPRPFDLVHVGRWLIYVSLVYSLASAAQYVGVFASTVDAQKKQREKQA